MNTDCNYPAPTESSVPFTYAEKPQEEPITIKGEQYILMPQEYTTQALVLQYDPIMQRWNKVL